MKKIKQSTYFSSRKTELFYGKNATFAWWKKNKTFFSEKSRISIFKIQCKEKDEKIRIVNIFRE